MELKEDPQAIIPLVDHIYQDPHESNYKFRLHYGDITD